MPGPDRDPDRHRMHGRRVCESVGAPFIVIAVDAALKGRFMTMTGQSTAELVKATVDGDLPAVRRHLDAGADVNTRSPGSGTLLHLAALGGLTKIAKLLIERGADVNATDRYGKTPLHCAARGGYEEVATLLLEHGADVNAMARNGALPLDWSVKFERDAMASFLRQHGARNGKALRP